MEKIFIKTEYIKADQFLKYISVVSSGSEAKMVIGEGRVAVNGEIIFQRGKKLRSGDEIVFDNKKYILSGQ